MTGLEKIIAEIESEAAAEAAKAVANATAQAEEILAEAQKEADARAGRIGGAADADVADIERSRESALALQRRQRTLAAKQAVLAETLQRARQALYQLPAEEYFALLVKLAAQNAERGEGEMLLNEADKERMPRDFEKKLKAALPQGCTLSVGGGSRPIDGGFVLRYGDIEENCSFAALFSARADEFSDLVRGILFAGASADAG